MKRTTKRLLALLGGALGLGAILRRRHRPPAPAPSPAAELKAKLAVTKEPELQTEPQLEPQPEPKAQPEPDPRPEPDPQPQLKPAAGPDSVDERRADAHARARHAIEELREKSE